MAVIEEELIDTGYIASTDNGIKYRLFQGRTDHKYYIKRFNGIFEITLSDSKEKWFACEPLRGGGYIQKSK